MKASRDGYVLHKFEFKCEDNSDGDTTVVLWRLQQKAVLPEFYESASQGAVVLEACSRGLRIEGSGKGKDKERI